MSKKAAWKSLAVPSEPQKMFIISPITGGPLKDKEGKEAFISFYSADDPVADDTRRKLFNEATKSAARGGRRAQRGLSMDEAMEAQAELLSAIAHDWYLVGLDGEPIYEDEGAQQTDGQTKVPYKFTKKRAYEIFLDRSMLWLREQADEFTNDRTNFIKAS